MGDIKNIGASLHNELYPHHLRRIHDRVPLGGDPAALDMTGELFGRIQTRTVEALHAASSLPSRLHFFETLDLFLHLVYRSLLGVILHR